MKTVREVIEFEEVVDEFIDVGETIDDLSVVRLFLVKDVHDDSLELTVEIFGAGDPDEEGPVLEFNINTDFLLQEDNLVKGINSKTIPALFDSDLLDTMIDRGTQIIWNYGDETEKQISLSKPGSIALLPMLQ